MAIQNTAQRATTIDRRQAALNKITTKLVCLIVIPLILIAVFAYVVTADTGQTKAFLLLFVFVTGVLGGFISIQQRLPKASLSDLEGLAASWASLVMMPVTGGVFALVLYIMFAGNILSGALFPAFVYPDFAPETTKIADNVRLAFFETAPRGAEDVSKIFFWAFAAGFLERFVPRLITTSASNVQIDDDPVYVSSVDVPQMHERHTGSPARTKEQATT